MNYATIKLMKRLIKFFSQKKAKKNKKENLETKVQKGISFAIDHYGETFKDLARYDRGEKLVN